MFAIKREVYQGSDGVQVDAMSQVKTFDSYYEAKRVADNCSGRVVEVIKFEKKPTVVRNRKPVKPNQSWMRR